MLARVGIPPCAVVMAGYLAMGAPIVTDSGDDGDAIITGHVATDIPDDERHAVIIAGRRTGAMAYSIDPPVCHQAEFNAFHREDFQQCTSKTCF
jgi:hypothetical protein